MQIKILKQKVTYTKNMLLRSGIYQDVVTKILLGKITKGEWPEEARDLISPLIKEKKILTRKKKWSMSKESIARGLDPNR